MRCGEAIISNQVLVLKEKLRFNRLEMKQRAMNRVTHIAYHPNRVTFNICACHPGTAGAPKDSLRQNRAHGHPGCVGMCKQRVPGRGENKCKGPEAGACRADWKPSKEAPW